MTFKQLLKGATQEFAAADKASRAILLRSKVTLQSLAAEPKTAPESLLSSSVLSPSFNLVLMACGCR